VLGVKTWSNVWIVLLLTGYIIFLPFSENLKLINVFIYIYIYIFFYFQIGTPVTRWASIAFGAGVGIGSAYTDCSQIFDGSTAKLVPPKTTSSAPEELQPPNTLSTPASQVC
jgi:hypothetical protein